MIKQLSLRHCVFLAALISAATLAGALVGQYAFGLHPCDLCIKQRVPHVVVAALGALSMWHKRWRLSAVVMVAALLIGAGIALFHVGVEAGMFNTGCSGALPENASLEDIRAAIANAPLVSCAQAMGYVFGLSLAAWNALISFGVAAALAAMVWKERART